MNDPRIKKTLPVNLLSEGRQCLVVGGGKVALRKIENLLESGAFVNVVSPELVSNIKDMLTTKQIKHTARIFTDTDTDNMFLVFAATDDKNVNKQVMESCRKRNIICCSVDGNWKDADFVTPATFRKDHITVAIATGGQSCRQSRLIKENLSKHLAMVENADLIVMGTSHEELALQQREPFHLLGERLDQTGEMLMHVWGIHEFIILNTCNRVELIAVISPQTGTNEVLKRIMAFFHLKPHEYYIKRGYEAFEHVCVLSAGLLSQTPGENHIVAQVKDALDYALNAGWANSMMQDWISSALHVSKDIRQITTPLLKNFEIEDLCINYLTAECPNIKNMNVMILGAGTIGSEVIKRIEKLGCACKWCYHVNKPEIPANMSDSITLCTFNDLRNNLSDVDIIICATTSTGYVLHQGHAPFLNQEKDIRIVDLAIPRNVAPEMNELTPNISVTDLDDLKHWFRRELADMAKILDLSKQTVEKHKDLYEKIIRQFQGGNKVE